MAVYRRGTHRTQFDGSPLAGENCTPTSGANGAREATDGKYDHSGGFIRNLVARSEETNPSTPGWSLSDLDLAMSRAGVPFVKGSGGWTGVRAARTKGQGIVLQGDSDQFSDGTCSGAFNGDHAVYVHPETKVEGGVTYWMLGDPICKGWRWEKESELRDYATKFNSGILYGIFTTPVRKLSITTQEVNDMAQAPHTDETPKLIDIAVGTVLYDLDGATAYGKATSDLKDRYSPFGVTDGRAFYIGAFGTSRIIKIAKTFSNVRAAIDPTPYSAADLEAAKVAGATEGTVAEKSRLRKLLGL